MSNPTRVVVVFHSQSGRTRALAAAVAEGASAVDGVVGEMMTSDEAMGAAARLAAADAIVLGCPTYMGSVSGAFKTFMDSTTAVWALQGWRDKLAAGFTHSSAPSGDKLGTLMQLAVFAAQHGMVWIGLGLPPTYASDSAEAEGVNRLGSHLGAMAQSRPGGGVLPPSDLLTARHLGRRVAEAALRWQRAGAPAAAGERHPSTQTWVFPSPHRPPLRRGLERANLRELAARPGRFEHHLAVCASVDGAQLEVVTASEPLAFAHLNISDEYALALPTGDDLVDGFPLRTFVSDPESGEDVGRYNHRTGDVLLHPHGYTHWPGRQRPPYEVFRFPPGMRRTGLALVYCASRPTPPGERTIRTPAGREGDAKAYTTPAPPLALMPTTGTLATPGVVARVGSSSLALAVRPAAIAPPRGGWVVILEAEEGSPHAACDLVRVPEGEALDGAGIVRALVLASAEAEPDPAPSLWQAVPPAPFAPFEDLPAGSLPLVHGALRIEAAGDDRVCVDIDVDGKRARAEVPRHWLARLLFRAGLHGFRMGYTETYGGFFLDDRDDVVRLGLHDTPARTHVALDVPRTEALALVERLYRAVAPPGYQERADG